MALNFADRLLNKKQDTKTIRKLFFVKGLQSAFIIVH